MAELTQMLAQEMDRWGRPGGGMPVLDGPGPGSGLGSHAPDRAAGKLLGFAVIPVVAKEASLQHISEEIGFSLTSKVESLSIRQRNVTAKARPKLPSPHEIEGLFKSMQDEDALAGLRDFSAQLLARLRRGDSPRRLLKERFSDPTKRHHALAFALHHARERDAGSQETERLFDLLAESEDENGPAIRAGLNTLEAAAEFGPTAEAGDTFRRTYRDAVIGYESFAVTLDKVLAQFGEDKFQHGTALLLKALAADLQSVRSSIDPNRLHAILQDLYHLEAVTTLIARCGNLCRRLSQGDAVKGMTPISLTRDVVGVTKETYVTAYHFSDIARKYGIGDNELQVHFYTGMLAAVRSLPVKVFRGDEARMKAIEAVQQALDAILLSDGLD